MKNMSCLLTLLLVPALANAQATSQQAMMQNMQKAQACMAQIDQSALERFSDEAQVMESEIKSLCAQGKRDAAQAQAMTYGKEVSTRPELVKMRECMALMKGMMPVTPYFGPEEDSDRHVCDS